MGDTRYNYTLQPVNCKFSLVKHCQMEKGTGRNEETDVNLKDGVDASLEQKMSGPERDRLSAVLILARSQIKDPQDPAQTAHYDLL